MYALYDANWELCGLYNDMRLALAEMDDTYYSLTLVNNVTGEVITNNYNWALPIIM